MRCITVTANGVDYTNWRAKVEMQALGIKPGENNNCRMYELKRQPKIMRMTHQNFN